jgi:RNA polymerase sigma factor (sigma-70 family)
MLTTAESADSSTGDLVSAARQGDVLAREQLVERYGGLVWSTVRSFRLGDADAHDAVQTTWLRMIEQLGRIRDGDRLGAWLATTARRECLRIIGRRRRELVGADTALADRPDDASPTPERATVDRAMADLLWAHVADLPAGGRDLLVTMTRSDRPPYAEYARRTGMPVGSIGPTRMRYLKRLRHQLEESGLDVHAWR